MKYGLSGKTLTAIVVPSKQIKASQNLVACLNRKAHLNKMLPITIPQSAPAVSQIKLNSAPN